MYGMDSVCLYILSVCEVLEVLVSRVIDHVPRSTCLGDACVVCVVDTLMMAQCSLLYVVVSQKFQRQMMGGTEL